MMRGQAKFWKVYVHNFWRELSCGLNEQGWTLLAVDGSAPLTMTVVYARARWYCSKEDAWTKVGSQCCRRSGDRLPRIDTGALRWTPAPDWVSVVAVFCEVRLFYLGRFGVIFLAVNYAADHIVNYEGSNFVGWCDRYWCIGRIGKEFQTATTVWQIIYIQCRNFCTACIIIKKNGWRSPIRLTGRY